MKVKDREIGKLYLFVNKYKVGIPPAAITKICYLGEIG